MNGTERDARQHAFLERAIETQLRSALLRVAREGSNLQDRIDCAELALATGTREAARSLYAVIFLHMGFAADAIADQRAIAAETGLWAETDWPEAASALPPPKFSVERAIGELAELMRTAPAGGGSDKFDAVIIAPEQGAGSGIQLSLDEEGFEREVTSSCEALSDALRQPWTAVAGTLPKLLADLHARLIDGPSFDPREHVQDTIARLAAIVALSDLQLFLRENYALAYGADGSPRLLHAAAQASRGGLGPFFTNVRHIIRDVPDLFGLAEAAAGERRADGDAAGRWTNLLASHIEHQQLLDFVDELADRGMRAALWAIFQARARRVSIWRDYILLQRLRDGALDLGDWALAIRAQEMIVHVAAHDPGELNVLGTILANAGEMEQAEEVFATYAVQAPGDKTLAPRLAVLREGRALDFASVGGLCTPPHRKRMRLTLWQPDLAARLAPATAEAA